MINYIFILLSMVFLHIIDDYKLQGILASMKQQNWWQKQENYKSLYKYDYIPALLEHSFSWTFMIMLPIAFSMQFKIGLWLIAYIVNLIIHAFIDDLKANKLKINLIVDQLIHIIQIFITWIIFVYLK
jgi:hypothetical protein